MTDKKPEIVFAPGCFDNFDGTQEELQDMLAQLHQMVEDGTLLEKSTPVSDEEAEEFYAMLANKEKRQGVMKTYLYPTFLDRQKTSKS